MKREALHSWGLKPNQAIALQLALRNRLVHTWDGRPVTTVGGIDVSIKDGLARAAVVTLHFPELTPIEGVTAEVQITFPYIPGLLSFREGPVVLAAWEKLAHKPDLLLFDGQGIAHPRGIGIASHLGLWLERPSIGVAKSRLYGRHAEPGGQRADWVELMDEKDPKQVIGAVLRTRTDVKPVYVSPGHLIDVKHSVHFVLACCTRYRLPEPIRWAHRVAGGEKLTLGSVFQPRLLF